MGCVAEDVFLLSQSRYTLGSVRGLVYFKSRCHSGRALPSIFVQADSREDIPYCSIKALAYPTQSLSPGH